MSEHTPGPWEVDEDRDQNDQATVTGSGGWLVAVVPHGCIASGEVTMEANARLIAAAPELLEALKWAQPAVEELHGQDIGCPSCQSAYPEGPDARCNLMDGIAAAIAKAEGR